MLTSCTNKLYGSLPVLNYSKMNDSKCWNSVTAVSHISTESNGYGDTEKIIKNKLKLIKSKFHRERKLLVKHLPRNVIKQEIAQLLNDFPIEYINLTNNDDTSSTAIVTLENPEILDDWNSDRTFLLRGQSISVSPTQTEMFLCVAKLPFYYDENDFYNLIKSYGEIKMYFLMISEKTGKSKGYGFVQYTNKEHALAARNALNDKIVDTFQLVCDWLDSSHLTFKSLHSTCLYVDKLPKQFRDMGQFRKTFAKVVDPPYCQIALKNGCPLDWGLVEYLSPENAELAQTSCNNYCLRNQPIRVVYYIPGVRAINLYLRLLNDQPSRGKSTGLLPDPTGQSIMMSIQNLSKQNPIFAQNLKNIILHQIQESTQVKENGDEIKQNSIGKGLETNKNTDRVMQKKNYQNDAEKIISHSPPMAPPLINTLPILNNYNGFVPVTQTVPMLPSTSIPPPILEKLAFNPPISINLKDKSCVKPQLFWNDILGQTFTNGTYTSVLPTIAAESTATAYAVAPNQFPANFIQELNNLPLNVQQNIFNLINNASPVSPASVPPMTNIGSVPSLFSPFVQTIDPGWTFSNTPEHFVSTNFPQSLFTLPVASKTVIPNTWTSMPPFMPPGVMPTIFTTADWENARMPSCVFTSQSSTPISQHIGQKRKLLPSPEKSPEGNYIGQHSQGIGGHYADSYFKKKKMY